MSENIRNVIKDLLPPLILRRIRPLLHWIWPPRESAYYGLDGLDQKLEKYLDYDNGFYVELGANDGVSHSNTFYYERNRGWKGVLIEPSPHNYLKCKESRSSRNHMFCAACVGMDYKEEFVRMAFSNLMSIPIGLESDIIDPIAHANLGKQFLPEWQDVFIFGAKARTLNDLLLEANAPCQIDFLSLDVEGAEIEVLKGVDHHRFRFTWICIECRDFERMSNYLSQFRYEFVEKLSDHDYLFKDSTT
jgi:FkbM family methyltransferase